MGNAYMETGLLDKAIKFAVDAHHNTERRGKGFPYIVHPMEAVAIVATMTPDQEMLAAAALHDTVEDTDTTVEQLREEFGPRVASLVFAETDKVIDNGPNESASWRSRKALGIKSLADAPLDVKMVAMGDKLSNMRAIARDYHDMGDKLWNIFHAPNGRSDHEWRYRSLVECFSDLEGTAAYSELSYLVDSVFREPHPVEINMEDYEACGGGFRSVTYNAKAGGRMLKMYNVGVPVDNAVLELRRAWNVWNLGLKTAEAHRLVTDGMRFGLEFERVENKKSLCSVIADNPDSLEETARNFAVECRLLHSTVCRKRTLPDVKDRFRAAVNGSSMLNDIAKKVVLDFIDGTPDAGTCVHGDLHPGNMITDGKQRFWIDLMDFSCGNPLFDLGMLYLCTHFNEDFMTRRLFHLDNGTMLRFWDFFAKEYFTGDCPVKYDEKEFAKYACLYMICFESLGAIEPLMTGYINRYLLGE